MNHVRMVIGIALVILVAAAGIAVASAGSEASAKQEPVQIKMFSVRSFPKEGTEIPPKLEALVSSKVGFPVKFILMGGVEDTELHATVDKLLAANDLPDAFLRFTIDPKFLDQAATKFTVQFYKENMPGHYKWALEVAKSIDMGEKTAFANHQDPKDGMMWGAPVIWEGATVPYGQMWRKDILDQLGFKIPVTLADAEKVYAAYKATYPDKYAVTGRGQVDWQCFTAVFNAYGLVHAEHVYNNKIVQDFTIREFREAIQVLTRWYAKGYWDPNFLTQNLEWVYNFAAGQYVGPIAWVKDWNFPEESYKGWMDDLKKIPGAVAVAAPFLRADLNTRPAGMVGLPFLKQITVFGKHLEKDREKLKKVMRVYDLFSQDRDVQLLSQCGIEGVHYTIPKGEVVPVPTDLLKGVGVREISEKWGFGSYWGNLISGREYSSSQWDKMLKDFVLSPNAIYGKNNLRYYYGGQTVLGPVTDEAGQPVQVTMKQGWFPMVVEIMTGKKPIEYYDEWLQAYYDGGGKNWEYHATRLYLNRALNKY